MHLAKGTAPFLLPGLLAAALSRGARGLRDRRVWLGLLAAVTVTSPLWVRNAVFFGSPLYNDNQKLVWLDSFEQGDRLEGTAEWDAIGASWYLRRHGARDAAERLGRGLAAQPALMAELLTPYSLPRAAGWVLLLLAAGGLLRAAREERLFLLAGLAAFLAFFSWYHPVGGHARFYAPFLPPLAQLAARLPADLLDRRMRRPALRAALPWLLFGVPALLVVLLLPPFHGGPRRLAEVPRSYAETASWLAAHLREDEVWAEPNWLLFQPEGLFRMPGRRTRLYPEDFRDGPAEAMRRRGARYLAVTVFATPDRPMPEPFAIEPGRGLVQLREIPGLRPVFATPYARVLELAPRSGPSAGEPGPGRRGGS
jgi:hypothetical protein